jgi:hypothetical protein
LFDNYFLTQSDVTALDFFVERAQRKFALRSKNKNDWHCAAKRALDAHRERHDARRSLTGDFLEEAR